MPLGVERVWPCGCASLLLLPIDGLRATASAAAGARAAVGRGCGGEGAGVSCKRVSGDGVAVAGAVAAGGGGLAVVWCSCRHARPATPSLIEVRAATWGEDRSARVMMVTAAEEGEDGVQWQL